MAIGMISSDRKLSFNRIYKGDSRKLVEKLPDRSITVTLTSPPYWNLKDYGVSNQIGWDQSYSQYMDDMIHIFKHVYRATKDTGSLWVVLDLSCQ
jgi:DNA modification methylase